MKHSSRAPRAARRVVPALTDGLASTRSCVPCPSWESCSVLLVLNRWHPGSCAPLRAGPFRPIRMGRPRPRWSRI